MLLDVLCDHLGTSQELFSDHVIVHSFVPIFVLLVNCSCVHLLVRMNS